MINRPLRSTLAAALVLLASASTFARSEGRYGREYFPNVPVVDQNGTVHSFYDDLLHGKLVVISFIFASCRDICPLITARLAQLRERLDADVRRGVRFISITIDPVNDTPQLLKEHAEAFQADPDWLFLTGKPEDITLINHKLGERSKILTDHRAEIVLGNDITGDWARDSAFSDLNVLASTVRDLDPVKRRSAAALKVRDRAVAIPEKDVLPGQALFMKTCAACHAFGESRRSGPDLLNVTARRERAWLASFITAPEAMRVARDPIALQLSRSFKGTRMPTLGLSSNDASDLIAYIEFQSFKAKELNSPQAHHHDHGAHGHQAAGATPKH